MSCEWALGEVLGQWAMAKERVWATCSCCVHVLSSSAWSLTYKSYLVISAIESAWPYGVAGVAEPSFLESRWLHSLLMFDNSLPYFHQDPETGQELIFKWCVTLCCNLSGLLKNPIIDIWLWFSFALTSTWICSLKVTWNYIFFQFWLS